MTSHLNIQKPFQATADGYQLTGTSAPGQPLTRNGYEVEGRGSNGTFAVYVALENGDNTFIFQQGGSEAAITITMGNSNSPNTAITSLAELPEPLPQFDLAVKIGLTFALKCYAPSATAVTATVNDKDYRLTRDGSYFTGSYTIPSAEGTVELGAVEYRITDAQGTHTEASAGRLFAVGKDDTLRVRVASVSTTVFKEASLGSAFVATAKRGAVDYVTDYYGDMYKLATGGWITAKTVLPLTRNVSMNNEVEEEKVLKPSEYWKSKGIRKPGKSSFKENPEENQVVFEGVHEAIIDRETWEMVQRIREGTKRRQPKNTEKHMFAGILYCADCGRKLHFNVNHPHTELKYFNCSNYRGNRGTCNETHYIRADSLEQVMLLEIRRMTAYLRDKEDGFIRAP